ncbi:hypothetical protein [Gimesia chilikensis]|uniref:hypothetical protein n=1 Tax=Gimesia chilikensis TaxID=2605989 RepID=UPI003A8E7C39
MPLSRFDHERLVELKDNVRGLHADKEADIRFLAECIWKINLYLQQQSDIEAERSE